MLATQQGGHGHWLAQGYCSETLSQAVQVGRLFIDAGSSVTSNADRTIRSARLLGASRFDGVNLPPGTIWLRANNEYDFPSPVNIGPVQLNGQATLLYSEADETRPGTYVAARRPGQEGTVSFEGTEVIEVVFTEPDYAVDRIYLDKPGRIRGLLVADFFSADGHVFAFSSGGRQVVDGVRLGGCEAVTMSNGKVTSHFLYPPFRRQIGNVRCVAAPPAKRVRR